MPRRTPLSSLRADDTWIDVTPLPDGSVAIASVSDTQVVVEQMAIDGAALLLWSRAIAPGQFGYLRAAADARGRVACIGQGQDGQAWLTRDGHPIESLGETFGVFCVEVQGLQQGWELAILRHGYYELLMLPLEGAPVVTATVATPTTQGFIQIDDGVVLQDDGRHAVPGLVLAERAGRFAAGQNPDAGPDRVRLTDDTGRFAALVEDTAQPPHVVEAHDGTLWVCSWLKSGAWFAGYQPSDIPWGNDSAPVPPEPPAQPPRVTIREYTPTSGPSPLEVRAVAAVQAASGPVTTLQWLARRAGASEWTSIATNRADDLDHTYTFDEPGRWELALRGFGPGGRDQTATPRIVTVSPAPTPPEPVPMPPPETGVVTSFLCHDGTHYLCADLGVNDADGPCRLVADRTGIGLYEQFTIVPQDGGGVALWCHANGKYLRAAHGGGAGLYADRDTVELHELFTLEHMQDERYTLRTVDWWYVCAEEGGGGAVNANRKDAGPWETFLSTTPLRPASGPGGARIQGQLRFDGRCLVDDTGPVLPVFAHLGDGFAQWIRDPGYVEALLADIVKAGYHGVRFWTALGGDYWRGLEVGPTYQPDYWNQLEAWLRLLQKLGLVCHFCQGSTYPAEIGDDADGFARTCGNVVNKVGSNVVAVFEGANESRDTTPGWDSDRLLRFVQAFKSVCPNVLCMGSAYTGHEDAEITNDYNRGCCDVATYHAMRLESLDATMQHAFSFAYIGTEYEGRDPVAVDRRIIWNGEGNGPGALVSAHGDRAWMTPESMAAWCGIALMCRQPFNFFSGPGVKCKSEPMQSMPGFWTCPPLASVLPKDVMGWKIIHGGDTWKHERIFKVTSDDGRCAQALSGDGRFCAWHYAGTIEQVRGTIEQTIHYGPATLYMGRV